jgi:hypothetical protein
VGIQASASSTLNLRVQPLQFCPGIVDFELPIDAALFGIRFVRPDPDLGLQQRHFTDAAVAQALARQATQFAFGDVQPTAMLRRVAEVDPPDIGPRLLGWERRVERSFGMRVEVVADQGNLGAVGVARVS